jgi:hypothetical protein
MAVPSNNSHLKNTTGGTFVSQTQGGTILGNDTTGDVITKSLTLLDGVAVAPDSNMLPSVTASGIYNVQKALSAGTFGYSEEGKYVIARSSSTLSGVSKTQLLTMGKLLTGWRQNQFSWTGTLDSGATITNMRINWLNSSGTAAASPAELDGTAMAGATTGSDVQGTADNAGNPTRAIPGELVLKVDFVTLSVSSGGDFFDYKAITGM